MKDWWDWKVVDFEECELFDCEEKQGFGCYEEKQGFGCYGEK